MFSMVTNWCELEPGLGFCAAEECYDVDLRLQERPYSHITTVILIEILSKTCSAKAVAHFNFGFCWSLALPSYL